MDAATLRKILTVPERNALVLAARYRNDLAEVARELRGDREIVDKNGDLSVRRGRGGVSMADAGELLESARRKVAAHLERERRAAGRVTENGNGTAPIGPVREGGSFPDRDAPRSGLLDRPDAPRRRTAGEAPADAPPAERKVRRRPGEAQWALVQYVREHGPCSQVEARTAARIESTSMPDMMRALVARGILDFTGERDGRSPIIRLGPKADALEPPKHLRASHAPTAPGGGSGAADAGATPSDTPPARGETDGATRQGVEAGHEQRPASSSDGAGPPESRRASTGPEGQPAADDAVPGSGAPAGLLDRYLDALLQRIASGAEVPDRVFEFVESRLS